MNPITLNFIDKNLEKKFQNHQIESATHQFALNLKVLMLNSLISSILWLIKGYLLFGGLLVGFILLLIVIYYIVVLRKFLNSRIIYFMSLLNVYASLYQLSIFTSNLQIGDQLWMEDLTLLMAMQFTTSQNFVANLCLKVIFYGIRFALRFKYGLNVLSINALIYLIFAIYHDHNAIRLLRSEYLLKELNSNQFDILDNQVQDNILILNYDDFWLRFTQLFANKAFLTNVSKYGMEFIKAIKCDSNMNLLQLIYTKIMKKEESHSMETYHKKLKAQLQIHIHIYYIPEVQVVIAIRQVVQNQMNNFREKFYRNLLQKIRSSDKLLYYQQAQKTLLAYVLFRPEQLKLDITSLNFEMLHSIFQEKNIKARIQCFKKQIYTNIPLLDSLINLLRKTYSINLLLVEYVEQGKYLKFIVFGRRKIQSNTKNLEMQNALIRKISHLIYLSAWQMQEQKCQFTLLNMLKYQRFGLDEDVHLM